MELLLLILGIAAIVWLFNFDKPLRQIAEMANREVALQDASHKVKAVKAYGKLELSAEDVSKAKAVQEQINAFEI